MSERRPTASAVKSLDAYRAIWFDAADTLITIQDSPKLFAAYLANHSLIVSTERIRQALDDAFLNLYYRRKPEQFAACTPASERSFWIAFYRYVLEILDLWPKLDEQVAPRMCDELYELYHSPEHYIMFDDVLPVLDKLREAGYHMAVVSNFAPALPRILSDKGIAEYVDPIVVSTLVGCEKPDPRIFLYTLEKTGMKPEEVLYVGDHEINDVWAPRQVGIDAVRIKRYAEQRGEGITSLHELFTLPYR